MNRRHFLAAGVAAATLPPAFAAADGPASRTFRVLRAGSDIGRHTLSARIGAEGFVIDIEAEIVVRFAGIAVYRYELTNREVWQGRRLIRLDSTVNDDGDPFEVSIRAGSEGLEIDGTEFSGTAPRDAATTSYFAPAFADRRPWISTQSGKPLSVETSFSDRPEGGRRLRVTGELTQTILYDARGEWIGSEFDARGEPGRYETIEETGEVAALWERA